MLSSEAPPLLHRDHKLVQSSKIGIQDKSLCFSVLAFIQGPRNTTGKTFDYIDVCAALDNKTSHLVTLVHSTLSASSETKMTKRARQTTQNRQHLLTKTFLVSGFSKSTLNCLPPQTLRLPWNRFTAISWSLTHPARCSRKFARSCLIQFLLAVTLLILPITLIDESDEVNDKQRMITVSNFQVVTVETRCMLFPNADRIVYSACLIYLGRMKSWCQMHFQW